MDGVRLEHNTCRDTLQKYLDQFHLVQWVMDVLDEVRREFCQEAYVEVKLLKKEHPRTKGRPKEDDQISSKIRGVKAKADEIKNSGLCPRQSTRAPYRKPDASQ